MPIRSRSTAKNAKVGNKTRRIAGNPRCCAAIWSRTPAAARLTLDALPRFAERTGLKLPDDIDKIERFFANETANLILARILLIRFLEDHGFFDVEGPDGTQRRRYLCNGGVAAFQGMHEYFDHGYTRLLEEAYRTGGHFYSCGFR